MGEMTGQFDEDLNMKTCLQKCLETSHNHLETALGSKEVIKTLIRGQPMSLVIITEDLLSQFRDIILEKCKVLNIPIVELKTREELGEVFPVGSVKKAGAVGIKNFVCE